MSRLLIRLLPPEMRRRYGEELEELLLLTDRPLRDRWDLLLLVVRLNLEVIARRLARPSSAKEARAAYRLAILVALGGGLVLLWGNLALGMIGSEGKRANMMYLGVLAVGIGGSVVARFRPQGMARALLGMALAQASVAAVALGAGMHHYPGSSVLEILWLNGFFVVVFAGAAWLFRHAARAQLPSA